jgi:hypothetical protein
VMHVGLLSRIQDHPRALHHPERQRDRAGRPLKLTTLILGKLDHMLAGPGARHTILRPQPPTLPNKPQDLQTRPLDGIESRSAGAAKHLGQTTHSRVTDPRHQKPGRFAGDRGRFDILPNQRDGRIRTGDPCSQSAIGSRFVRAESRMDTEDSPAALA